MFYSNIEYRGGAHTLSADTPEHLVEDVREMLENHCNIQRNTAQEIKVPSEINLNGELLKVSFQWTVLDHILADLNDCKKVAVANKLHHHPMNNVIAEMASVLKKEFAHLVKHVKRI